jgi:hypothetical protein
LELSIRFLMSRPQAEFENFQVAFAGSRFRRQ